MFNLSLLRGAVLHSLSLTLVMSPGYGIAAESLPSLYEKAVQYDAQYRAAAAETAADREEINKAAAPFRPRVQFTSNYGRGLTDRTADTPTGDVNSTLNYTLQNHALSIRQSLFNAEARAAYRSTEASIRSSESQLNKEQVSLMTRVANAYFEFLFAQQRIKVTEEKIRAVSAQRDQAQRRYDLGEGTITEISEADTNLELAEVELEDALNTFSLHKQTLIRLTGEPVERVAPLNLDVLPTSMPDGMQLADWISQAETNNPDIITGRHALDVAREEVSRKQAGHYPTLDLVGVRSISENDNNNTLGLRFDSTTLALQLSVPLYGGGLTSANVRQAESRVIAAQAQLDQRMLETRNDVQRYYNTIQTTLRSIRAYTQAVASSEVALEGTQHGFLAGLRSNIDVLNAQQKVFMNRLQLTKSQYLLVNDLINLRVTAGDLQASNVSSLQRYFMQTSEPTTASPAIPGAYRGLAVPPADDGVAVDVDDKALSRLLPPSVGKAAAKPAELPQALPVAEPAALSVQPVNIEPVKAEPLAVPQAEKTEQPELAPVPAPQAAEAPQVVEVPQVAVSEPVTVAPIAVSPALAGEESQAVSSDVPQALELPQAAQTPFQADAPLQADAPQAVPVEGSQEAEAPKAAPLESVPVVPVAVLQALPVEEAEAVSIEAPQALEAPQVVEAPQAVAQQVQVPTAKPVLAARQVKVRLNTPGHHSWNSSHLAW
ncbi:TolC family outer membrane protein [Methylobacillus flagellatus]|uniref:TolC family outer membrane protein n=1 Tax=Methylobacillus flagellatus TaxID=405 RepID=UPI0010F5281D|nr:TolC family outer membrane protein [Methylobacillus flagellatus]